MFVWICIGFYELVLVLYEFLWIYMTSMLSLILRVLVCQQRIWGFESPLCRYHSSWILWWRSVRELLPRETGWFHHQLLLVPHCCMQVIHEEHVYNRWRYVSLEEKAHCRDTWWINLPILSIYEFCKSWNEFEWILYECEGVIMSLYELVLPLY